MKNNNLIVVSLFLMLFLTLFSSDVFAQDANVIYSSHVQDYGWMNEVQSDEISGTIGENRRVEALKIRLSDENAENHIEYSVHVQDIGWMDYVRDGQEAGTTGESKSVEAFKLRLVGPVSQRYDIYYRAHLSDFGWMGWAKNDEVSGSTGFAKQLQAFQILLVDKNSPAPGFTGNHGPDRLKIRAGEKELDETTGLEYRAYCSNIAWQQPVMNGTTAGTCGQLLAVEKLSAALKNLSGSISYNTYLSDKGWQTPVANGEESGLSDSGVHVEAIQFLLDGDVKRQFDIYYRSHVTNIGWLGWTKNGATSGTINGNRAVEAFEVRLVHKGDSAPGSMDESFVDFNEFYQTHPKPQAVAGKRTLKNFLVTAMQPVGKTSYILGGGRRSKEPVAGVGGTYIGLYPQWKAFFDQQNENYDYTQHYYEFLNGLDCSGFVGWTVYNTLNTTSGGQGEIDFSYNEPKVYSQKGYGQYTPNGRITTYEPGDMVSMDYEGHIYIVIGTCSDGSMVLVHSSPPGVMISGTTPSYDQQTEATKLAHTYMQRYFSEYYRRYAGQLNKLSGNYMTKTSKFSWSPNIVGDPENLRNMDAEHVLKVLFNEKY